VACEETGRRGDGDKCEMCSGTGVMEIQGCPQRYVASICEAINLAGHAGKGLLPVVGGMLDQAAWFVSAWQALESDQNKIDEERSKRSR